MSTCTLTLFESGDGGAGKCYHEPCSFLESHYFQINRYWTFATFKKI